MRSNGHRRRLGGHRRPELDHGQPHIVGVSKTAYGLTTRRCLDSPHDLLGSTFGVARHGRGGRRRRHRTAAGWHGFRADRRGRSVQGRGVRAGRPRVRGTPSTGPHEPARRPPARLRGVAGQQVPGRREVSEVGAHAGARRPGRPLPPGRLLYPAGQVRPVRAALAGDRRGQLREVVRGGSRCGVRDPRRLGAGAVGADGPDAAAGGLRQRRTTEALHVLHRRPESEHPCDGGRGSRAECRRQSEDRLRGRLHLGALRHSGLLQAGRPGATQHSRGLVLDGVGHRRRHRQRRHDRHVGLLPPADHVRLRRPVADPAAAHPRNSCQGTGGYEAPAAVAGPRAVPAQQGHDRRRPRLQDGGDGREPRRTERDRRGRFR